MLLFYFIFYFILCPVFVILPICALIYTILTIVRFCKAPNNSFERRHQRTVLIWSLIATATTCGILGFIIHLFSQPIALM